MEQYKLVLVWQERSQSTFQELHKEVASLRKQMKHDRHVLLHLQQVIIRNDTRKQDTVSQGVNQGVNKGVNQGGGTAAAHGVHIRYPANRIPWLVEEASGGKSNVIDETSGRTNVDQAASSLEESDNSVGHDVQVLMHREKLMRRQVCIKSQYQGHFCN